MRESLQPFDSCENRIIYVLRSNWQNSHRFLRESLQPLDPCKCSKCCTLITSSQTVSVQVQPVRYPSQPGHNPPGSKFHTGTQA